MAPFSPQIYIIGYIFFLFYEFSNQKWLNVFVVLPSFFYFTMFIVSYTKIFTISSFVCCNGALFLFWSYFHLKFVSLATFFFVLWVFKTEMVKSFCCAAFILFWCHFHLRSASWGTFFFGFEFSNQKWLNVFVVLPSFFYFTVFIVSYTKIFTISSFVCCNCALFLFWSHFHLIYVSLATLFFCFMSFRNRNG